VDRDDARWRERLVEPREIDGRRVTGCVLDHEQDRLALEEGLKPLAGRVRR